MECSHDNNGDGAYGEVLKDLSWAETYFFYALSTKIMLFQAEHKYRGAMLPKESGYNSHLTLVKPLLEIFPRKFHTLHQIHLENHNIPYF